MAAESGTISINVKWSGVDYKIDGILQSSTVRDLKNKIEAKTGVLPERQKLLGLKFPGKNQNDDAKLSTLRLKDGSKIMMMGTKEEKLADIIAPPTEVTDVDIVDDFDIGEESIAVEKREEFLAKIQKRVETYKIDVLNEPREGKKLLVLDVDYTLFDHKSTAESGLELMRPYLHEFLTSAYDNYDIVIWSATSMKWIEAKMQELGVTSSKNYKIMFMLDSAAMITVDAPSYGLIETKPLGIIWGKYPQYNKENSLIIDDLRRNFLMNPQNGLKIRPFRKAYLNREKDKELLYLSKYIRQISTLKDFTSLDHRNWDRTHR